MDNSFYLKNGSVLWNGAFTPLDMAVEDGHITALSRGHHNEKGLPEVDAAGLRVLPGFLDLHTHGAAGVDVNAADAEGLECEVSAHAVNEAATIGRNADCILLGPQVGYAKDEVCAACPGVPVGVIPMTTYGMMDGVKALAQAKELMGL